MKNGKEQSPADRRPGGRDEALTPRVLKRAVPWLAALTAAAILTLPSCRSSKSATATTEERRDSVEAVYSQHHFRDATKMITDSLVTREWVWQITDTSGKTTTYRKNYVGHNSVNTNRIDTTSAFVHDIRVGNKTATSVQKQQTQTTKSPTGLITGVAALALIVAALAIAILAIRRLAR